MVVSKCFFVCAAVYSLNNNQTVGYRCSCTCIYGNELFLVICIYARIKLAYDYELSFCNFILLSLPITLNYFVNVYLYSTNHTNDIELF